MPEDRITVVAELEDGTILLKTPFSEKERCQMLRDRGVAKWDKRKRVWTLAGTTSAVNAIKEAFPSERYRRIGNQAFADLASRARLAEAAQVHKTREELPEIPGRTKAWLHQKQGYWFAHDLDAAGLFLGMGTGKTKLIIALAEGWDVSKALILCPSKVVDVWPAQFNGPLFIPDPKETECPECHGSGWEAVDAETGIKRSCEICDGDGRYMDETNVKKLDHGHAVRRWQVLALDKKQGGSVTRRASIAKQALENASARHPVAVVTNYQAAIREPMKSLLLEEMWDLVACDESDALKSPGGVTSKLAGRLHKRSRKRLCSTGTPFAQTPLDIYGQYRFLDPAIFGTSNFRFKQHYAVLGGFEGKQVVALQNEQELARKVASIAYQCGEEVLDLPPAMPPERRTCLLSKESVRIYNELDTELIADVKDGVVTASNALTRLLRLQQATSGHTKTDDDKALVIGEEKKGLLAELLEELPKEEPVVVFVRFRHDIRVVREVCEAQGRRCGEVSGAHSDLVGAKFPPDKDVLAVQIQSGGAGVDLTRAAYAVYFSIGFSLRDYLQSLKRVHRPGQTRPTHYYHLVAEKPGEKPKDRATVDQLVFEALKEREQVVERVLAAAREA